MKRLMMFLVVFNCTVRVSKCEVCDDGFIGSLSFGYSPKQKNKPPCVHDDDLNHFFALWCVWEPTEKEKGRRKGGKVDDL
jgi:hypothetical protein